jgi:hypothetical protein
MEEEIRKGMAALSNLPKGGIGAPSMGLGFNGGYASQNTSLTPTEIRIFMDPLAAAAGVTTAVIDNAANGNSNGYSPILSFAGG